MIYKIKKLETCDLPTFELIEIKEDDRGAMVQVPNGHRKYIIVETPTDSIEALQKSLLVEFFLTHQLVSDEELVLLKAKLRRYSYEVW